MTHEVNWCLKKLEEAHADYNMADAKNYTELLKQWLSKLKLEGGHDEQV